MMHCTAQMLRHLAWPSGAADSSGACQPLVVPASARIRPRLRKVRLTHAQADRQTRSNPMAATLQRPLLALRRATLVALTGFVVAHTPCAPSLAEQVVILLGNLTCLAMEACA